MVFLLDSAFIFIWFLRVWSSSIEEAVSGNVSMGDAIVHCVPRGRYNLNYYHSFSILLKLHDKAFLPCSLESRLTSALKTNYNPWGSSSASLEYLEYLTFQLFDDDNRGWARAFKVISMLTMQTWPAHSPSIDAINARAQATTCSSLGWAHKKNVSNNASISEQNVPDLFA